MPEPLAYDITRLLFEKQADLIAIHPQAKRPVAGDGDRRARRSRFIPGAIRYYTEKNAWKP